MLLKEKEEEMQEAAKRQYKVKQYEMPSEKYINKHGRDNYIKGLKRTKKK